jgi:hypothetical protein
MTYLIDMMYFGDTQTNSDERMPQFAVHKNRNETTRGSLCCWMFNQIFWNHSILAWLFP